MAITQERMRSQPPVAAVRLHLDGAERRALRNFLLTHDELDIGMRRRTLTALRAGETVTYATILDDGHLHTDILAALAVKTSAAPWLRPKPHPLEIYPVANALQYLAHLRAPLAWWDQMSLWARGFEKFQQSVSGVIDRHNVLRHRCLVLLAPQDFATLLSARGAMPKQLRVTHFPV